MRPHQVLAINRGETEKVLRVKVTVEEKDWKGSIVDYYRPDVRSPFCAELEAAITMPPNACCCLAIERDVRRELTVWAETHAIKVFASNLKALLGQPPLAGADRARAGPRLPHRHQAGGGRSHRQTAGYRHHLSACSRKTSGRNPRKNSKR